MIDAASVVPIATTGPAAGYYRAGDVLEFTVTFAAPVIVDTTAGIPRLVLTIGSATRYAYYASGGDTMTLMFRYWINAGDVDADGLVLDPTIDPNGGLLAAGALTFSAPDLADVRVVLPEGRAYGWGINSTGQLGIGSTATQVSPTAVDTSGALAGKSVIGIASGTNSSSPLYGFGLATTRDGAVFAWGNNSYGQLGDGTKISKLSPVATQMGGALEGRKVVAVDAGNIFSFALTEDGRVFAWGANGGRLGDGSTENSSVPVAVDVTGVLDGKTIVAIAAGGSHALALSDDGQVYAWGINNNGQLGDGTTTTRESPVAVDTSGVLAGKAVVAIAAGYSHSLALTSDGKVYAWGANGAGRLGDGTTNASSVPIAVDPSGALASTVVTAIAAGRDHSLAVGSDGDVFAWGEGSAGELGDGTSTDRTTPVAVEATGALAGKPVARVAAGWFQTQAFSRDGAAFAWGSDIVGQLGNGDLGNTAIPVATAGMLADQRILAIDVPVQGLFGLAIATTNSRPVDLALSASALGVTAANAGATIGTLTSFDPDPDDTHTVSLVAGEGDTHNASFVLDGATLKLAGAPLEVGSYSIRLRTTDAGALAFEKTFTISITDNIAPQVTSIARQSPATSPTNADTLVWRVTFNEPMQNVDAADFAVSGTTATVAAVASAGGNVYDVTVSGGDLAALNASVTLAFSAAHDLADTGGNALVDTAPSGTNDVTFVVANNAAPTDLALSSETVNQSAALAGATIGALATTDADAGDTHTYTFADGVGDTDNASFALDGATLTVGASALAPGSYSVRIRTRDPANASWEEAFAIAVLDDIAPAAPSTPDLSAASDSGSSNTDNFTRIATPTFTGTAEAGATVKLFSGENQIGVATADGVGNWTITASILAPGVHAITATATDAANNAGVASDALAFTIKTTAPVMTVGAPSAALTGSGPVTYAIAYSDSHFGASTLALGDLILNKTGTADGTLALNGSGTNYTVTITDITGDGTLGFAIAAGTATDLAGNAAAGAAASETFVVDNTAPAVVSILRQAPTTVHSDAAALAWRITFDGEVTGVDVADFAVTTLAGEAGAQIESVSALDAATYDVTATVGAGLTRLQLDLNGAGTGIADLAGNAIADGGFRSGEFYIAGAANVFETTVLAADGTRTVTTTNAVAQRFTTSAAGPLSLSSVAVRVGAVNGATPVVSVHRDDTGAPGAAVGRLENPDTLMPHALNVWTGLVSLEAETTYWIVLAATAGDYELVTTEATDGGSGEWLVAPAGYEYLTGLPDGPVAQPGALHLALGATRRPAITSALTASGTYQTVFSYRTEATNTPTSFAATGLPPGLSIDAATGEIAGAPTQTGAFNIDLTATNSSGPGPASTLVLTIGQAPLTATANAKSRSYGAGNPALTVSYTGFLGSDTAAALTTAPIATTTANASSPAGTYAITVSGGVSDNYTFTYEPGVLTITNADQVISFSGPGDLIIGASTTLTASASSGLPVSFSVIAGPATLSGSTLTTTGVGAVTVRSSQAGDADYSAAPNVDRSFNVTVGPATITTPAQVPTPPAGGTAELIVSNSNPNLDYTWQRNGANLPGGIGSSLTLTDVQPPTAGLYTYTATVPGGGSGTSEPVIVGLTTDEKVVGTGGLVGSDIQHPNGNVYDQVLLEGNGASITADQSKITRISFVDLSNDIVQVEFSGAGTLSVVMDDASSPSPAINYNQQDVDYVKGHVGLVITGANETSNLSVFSVGPVTAVNQSLFKPDVTYDGVANIAFVAIQSTNGKFGSIRTGNAHYFANQGFTGVYAPGVTFTGPVNIGDVTAFDSATPVLVFGAVALVQITGGNLAQDNGLPVTVGGIVAMKFVPGTTSQGDTLPAQANAGVLTEDGVDVTDDIVVAP